NIDPGDSSATSWHLLVPCLDEATVIARTIRGLRAAHPSAHVWCIDDASEDDTARALVEFADDLMVHVIWRKQQDARQGKGPALNAGWAAVREWVAEHDVPVEEAVVGVSDADARLASDALSVISGPEFFGDPSVGAVQVQVRMLNRGLPEHRVDGNDPAPSRGWR